ncbi:MAG: peptidylprolyl isomerase [Lewinellaceae bacterium]|nr:peptidylprolyl isomerase [Lewinellaceae bacterium]
MYKHILTAAFALFACAAFAQTDPALFTVDGHPVPVSEFKYIYAKTNQEKADFSEKSLRDYLDLYIKFKLKVQKARDMQLDTIPALRSELEGYRRQLANSYLVDKEVTDKLIRETYERMKQDVDISHIFIACDRNAKAADTLAAYSRAMNLLKMVKGGASFEQMAADSSEDKSAKDNKGRLGYVTAMLPDGYYELEKVIYDSKPGDIRIARSNAGYHIVKVNAFRPARGEIEVAHILFRKGDNEMKNAEQKNRVDSLYATLKRGADWEEACKRFSEDKVTATKAGYLGFFGINRYQRAFEDAAFALQNDGEITEPVETSIGWHIIKRLSYRPIGSFEAVKRVLTERVKRDSRSEVAKQIMIDRIKKESNFTDYPKVLEQWAAKQQDSVFLTFKWKPDPARPQTVLMRFNNNTYTVADFEDFCARSGRERMRGAGMPLIETIEKLYKAWTDDTAMHYEESQLDKKYPDFKSLMREYEEGILLFEALKQNVWDKANIDTAGLEKYFDANLKNKYNWDERARVSIYTLKTDDPKILADVRQYAAKKPAADVLKKFNKTEENETMTVLEKSYEKGKNKELGNLWKAGAMTDARTDAGTKTSSFMKIEEIMPPMSKTLSEARGYAVADYQDYLEKQWIETLRKEYPVKVNEDVLMSLVQKK